MAIAEELVGILGFKLEGQAALKGFNDGMDGAADKSGKTAKNMAALGKVGAAGVLAAGTIAVGAAKKFAGLEREMNRIGITAGASIEATQKATDDVQALATDLALPISDVVAGLDTLVASGMSLDEAMAFLPSVAATAQASGSSLVDIANTAQKTSDALGLTADQMNRAFDIMVQGGKDGQFELKDMAAYIPGLANSFATLGYSGEEGLKQLIAVLQTIREDTGSASAAATQAQNIFGKMYSEETANKFKKMGIDLRKSMEEGKAAGEDALTTFIRLSKEAIDGDLSKLPLLFSDQEFRLGMQSMITSGESFDKFLDSLNSAEVDGTVFRDLDRILGDTQASLDETSVKFERLINNIGKVTAPAVKGVLDFANEGLERQEAIASANKERGMSPTERLLFGLSSDKAKDARAREGGFIPESAKARVEAMGDDGAAIYRATSHENQITLPTQAPRTPGAAPVISAEIQALSASIASTNSWLAQMTGQASMDATITDARQDNRQFPITSNVTVNQTVQTASQAPAAVAQATGSAAANAASQQARVSQEPTF